MCLTRKVKISSLLSGLMLYAAVVGAATCEEILRLEAIQQPGTVWICRGEANVQSGTQRLMFRNTAHATVVSVSDKSKRYRMERVSTLNGAVRARYTYEMTSRMTEDASVEEIDSNTIHISYPEDAEENSRLYRLFRDHVNSRQPFEDVQINRFPEWDIVPALTDPTGMRYHCGPVRQED